MLIIYTKVVDPVVYSGTEWISVLFHGQSFMLHQVCNNSPHSIFILRCTDCMLVLYAH